MDFSSRVSHLAAFVAAVFALLLAAGCARITSLDLQLAPPGPADPSDEAGAEAQVAPGLALPVPGDILIVGGAGAARSTLASAEFFSAATGKFKPTATAMKTSRAVDALVAVPNPLHQAVVLGGMKGRGVSSIGALTLHAKVLNTAEAYNAVTGRFVPEANPMTDARTGLTATLFTSGPLQGKVLVAGGDDASGPVNTAEIFDPVANTFTALASTMTDAREFHTATLLNNGKVLLAGGFTDNVGTISATADIFDPATQTFTPTSGDMTTNRAGHTASLLMTGPNAGKVLLVDGVMSTSGSVTGLFSSELFDPATGKFTEDALTTESRAIHTAVTLNDGRILISGGMTGVITFKPGKIKGFGSTSNSSEIYDPKDSTFTCVNGTSNGFCAASMTSTRAGHIGMLITSGPNAGNVLLAGGLGAKNRFSFNDRVLRSAEIVTISGNTATSAKVSMVAARVGAAAVTLQ